MHHCPSSTRLGANNTERKQPTQITQYQFYSVFSYSNTSSNTTKPPQTLANITPGRFLHISNISKKIKQISLSLRISHTPHYTTHTPHAHHTTTRHITPASREYQSVYTNCLNFMLLTVLLPRKSRKRRGMIILIKGGV